MMLPISFRCFCSKNFIVCSNFEIVELGVLVVNDVVVARRCLGVVLLRFLNGVWNNVRFLHRGQGQDVCRLEAGSGARSWGSWKWCCSRLSCPCQDGSTTAFLWGSCRAARGPSACCRNSAHCKFVRIAARDPCCLQAH